MAGRIIRMRGPFVVILDEGVKLQLYLNSKTLSGQLLEEYKLLDFGDIIGVEGEIFKTNKRTNCKSVDFSNSHKGSASSPR